MKACPISLGCNPTHSHVDGCFPLPACKNIKEQFKHQSVVLPKRAFSGDPSQTHWTSDFHHIAPYAKIDHHQHKLLLRTRRDMVKTQSGGGFGATVSSTRWNQYGSFSIKLKSGSTGPGIVTAFLLSNPALGEEISFELTGKDPKKVITNYYRRIHQEDRPSSHDHSHHHHPPLSHKDGTPLDPHSYPDSNTDSHPHPHPHAQSRLEAHEETVELKKDSTTHELLYKIEWNENMIRWSVDGKVLRTVHAKDAAAHGGLPENPMQLQITIWDAGYSSATMDWAGGKTEYGPDNLDEYVAVVDSIEIACKNPKEGNKPWPGPDALKRLKEADAEAAEGARRSRKMNKGGYADHGHGQGQDQGLVASAKNFFRIAVLSLIKWTFVLLAIVCGAAYLTEPKSGPAASSSSARRNLNLGLQT
ncbi:CRH- protein [Mortierella alpina]|nr:CRH- protein [Mortierella alpina]